MRKASYLSRFLLLLLCCMLLVSFGSFLLSCYFSDVSYSAVWETELARAHLAGKELMHSDTDGRFNPHELQMQLNPILNTSDAFWVLYSPDRLPLAASDRAKQILSGEEIANQLQDLMDQAENSTIMEFSLRANPSASYRILLEKTDEGYVLTGVPGMDPASVNSGLRLRMLLSFPLLILLILLPGWFFARRGTRTVRLLTDAANRIREGESYSLPENLTGEVGEIAQTFNYMTEAIRHMITDLRHEKETMALILEGLSEGILAADGNGTLLHSNSAALRLLGGRDTQEFNTVWQALSEKTDQPVTGRLPAGDRILQYTITPLPSDGEETAGKVALIRDVTEEERLERTRHDYVANISHELRTPLASIRGLAEGLRDDMVTSESDRNRCYNIIADESNRLSRLVNDLLELSGLQADTNAFETEKVDPVELVYDLWDRNGSLFEKASLSLEKELPAEELPIVLSNEDRLSQVLTIFLDNARKYTPAGGRVILGALREEKGVRFFVKDNGIGMDEETCRLAFERFHQAEKSRSDKGSGLGLAIAREIMQKLGIQIHLVSAPGQGSEFSFVIPFPEPPAPADE